MQAQTHDPLPIRTGKVEREDDEYEREGTSSLFVAVEPLSGKRIIQARAPGTKAHWAYFMRELVEVLYPQAKKLVLVMANLNTHSPASFYEAFEPGLNCGC